MMTRYVNAVPVRAVLTTRGEIQAETIVNATAGHCSTIARMVGLDLPITSHPLQACVTEPLKPFRITRFYENKLVGEKAAAAVSH